MELRAKGSSPAPAAGLELLRRQWRLVLMVWVVSLLVQLPAQLVLQQTVLAAGAGLPPTASQAAGDHDLIMRAALRDAAGPLLLLSAYGLLLWWLWTPLWHGAIVGWQLRLDCRQARLGELISAGMALWWRLCRLSLLTAAVTLGLGLVAWLPLLLSLGRSPAPGLWLLLPVGAALGTALLLLLVWAARLRASWLLGSPAARPVVSAWASSLVQTLRAPLSSLVAMLAWLLPALLLSAVPLLLGWWLTPLRSGPAGQILSLAGELGRCCCWVGLLGSFAPANAPVSAPVNDDRAPVSDDPGNGSSTAPRP